MNQNEIQKHLFFQIAFIIFLIFTMGFTIFWLLTENVSAADMKVNCSSSDKSNCVGLFQGNNATSLNTNVITNFNTTSSYRYFSLTSMPLEINTKYTFKIYYWPGARTINNIYFRWYYTDINNNTQTVNGYANATYKPAWLNDVSINIASFTLTTSDYYRNNTSNFINLDFGSSGVIIKKIEITNTETENTSTILDAIEGVVMGATLENYSCFVNAEVDLVASLEGSYIAGSTGSINKNSDFNVSYKYGVAGNKSYQVNFKNYTNLQYGYLCWYKDDTVLSCSQYRNLSGYGTDPLTITSPDQANFLMITYRKGSGATLKGNICVNKEYQELDEVRKTNDKIDETNEKLDETNSYLKDDSDPTINNSAISDTLESVAIDDPLNYLLTLPLHTIQRINYHLSRNTCSPINLGSLYGTDLILPCINIKSRLGESLFNTIDILMAIGIGSVTLKKFYDSISNVLTLGKEKEVREKLELPTPMEFFAMIFGGGR